MRREPRTLADYGGRETDAARRVLVDIGQVLAAYFKDSIVVVGGWVPELLLHDEQNPHSGSNDVDIALDPDRLGGHSNSWTASWRWSAGTRATSGDNPAGQPSGPARAGPASSGASVNLKRIAMLTGGGTRPRLRPVQTGRVRDRRAEGRPS